MRDLCQLGHVIFGEGTDCTLKGNLGVQISLGMGHHPVSQPSSLKGHTQELVKRKLGDFKKKRLTTILQKKQSRS